jgi:hypothetical protein
MFSPCSRYHGEKSLRCGTQDNENVYFRPCLSSYVWEAQAEPCDDAADHRHLIIASNARAPSKPGVACTNNAADPAEYSQSMNIPQTKPHSRKPKRHRGMPTKHCVGKGDCKSPCPVRERAKDQDVSRREQRMRNLSGPQPTRSRAESAPPPQE